MMPARTLNMMVPANAEIILEGRVPAGERRIEGPFGDHFGHYSEAAEFPVFHINKVTHRRDAVYAATVVGKPPQEDKFPIDDCKISARSETCFGCSNGIANAGHEPGARFATGAGLVDDAVAFQP